MSRYIRISEEYYGSEGVYYIWLVCQGNNSRVRLCNCHRPGCLYIMGIRPIGERPIDLSIYASTHLPLFLLFFFFIVHLCRALAALVFGSSLPLCAEKRSSLLHESEGILCCFARKAIVRRHVSTTTILVLRGGFACQQYL
jgi:hypothetical protein